MGCCKSKNLRNMTPPVVSIIGSTGYIGKCLMPVFLEALKKGSLKELRVLTVQDKLNSEQIQSYVSSGAKAVSLSNYEDATGMAEALQGVDVFVSALGTAGETIENIKNTLLDALSKAKVKVYFPSEFGTNYYKVSVQHPLLDAKRTHFEAAKKKGLNPIRLHTSSIMETVFASWYCFDCNTRVWTTVGNGADIPCAITSGVDTARFTLEAVLLAHKDVSKCPDELEVYSDMRSLREYAKALDKVAGSETTINTVSMDDFMEEYNKDKEFFKLMRLLFAVGAFDLSKSKSVANNLLNPNESIWKLKRIEEYAQETNGTPWKAD